MMPLVGDAAKTELATSDDERLMLIVKAASKTPTINKANRMVRLVLRYEFECIASSFHGQDLRGKTNYSFGTAIVSING